LFDDDESVRLVQARRVRYRKCLIGQRCR
jgi:hypothetical protein